VTVALSFLLVASMSAPALTQPPRPTDFAALAPANTLLRFSSSDLATLRAVKVTGVQGTLVGIDVRPANRKLHGVSDSYALYTIDPNSGRATQVSTLTAPFDGGPRSGMDFNPQADRLRLVSTSGQNLRVHVDLGATAVDGAIVYDDKDKLAGKRPRLVGSAYTKSVANAPSTQLFNIDAAQDVLVLQDPPNDGRLRTVGPLGVDFALESGFDIQSGPGEAEAAFAATGSALYRIDLKTGAATRLGTLGGGSVVVIGLAVLPPPAAGGASERPRKAY